MKWLIRYLNVIVFVVLGALLIISVFKYISNDFLYALSYLTLALWIVFGGLSLKKGMVHNYILILLLVIGSINFDIKYYNGVLGYSTLFSATLNFGIFSLLVVYVLSRLAINYKKK
jgi:hypothetical protein